jgi:NADP-dependent 3-hydroxy acid dehydrogenase YdfG
MDRPRFALITAATSGSGFESARKFASRGYDIVITADNSAKLSASGQALMREFPAIDVHMMVADLATPLGPSNLHKEFLLLKRPLDVLVNTASGDLPDKFADSDIRDELAMLQQNVASLMALTKLFLPQMLRLHEGKIFFTTCDADPPAAAYLRAFAQDLSAELMGTGVTATTLMDDADDVDTATAPFFDRLRLAAVRRPPDHMTVSRLE